MEKDEKMDISEQNQSTAALLKRSVRNKRNIRKKITLHYLLTVICSSRLRCLEWLKDKGLIPRVMFCPSCNRKMAFETDEDAIDGYIWICKDCPDNPPHFSARHGSWLDGRKAPLVDILLFTYFWVYGFSESQISKELNMSLNSVREWSITYLDIASSAYQQKQTDDECIEETMNDHERKEALAVLWRGKNIYKDPFLEFLKDADSL